MPKYRVRYFYYVWEDEIVAADSVEDIEDDNYVILKERREIERSWENCRIEELADDD